MSSVATWYLLCMSSPYSEWDSKIADTCHVELKRSLVPYWIKDWEYKNHSYFTHSIKKTPVCFILKHKSHWYSRQFWLHLVSPPNKTRFLRIICPAAIPQNALHKAVRPHLDIHHDPLSIDKVRWDRTLPNTSTKLVKEEKQILVYLWLVNSPIDTSLPVVSLKWLNSTDLTQTGPRTHSTREVQ